MLVLHILWTLCVFLFLISLIVILHELGHFIMARLFGVKVLRFSVGFGKPLLSYRGKRGTTYVLSALPLGGYVKMLDDTEEKVLFSERHLAFNHKPLIARMLIVLAGPLFNMLLAIVAFWLMFVVGTKSIAPIVGKPVSGSIVERSGLTKGDEIVGIDGEKVTSWNAVNNMLLTYIGDKKRLDVQILRDGIQKQILLDLRRWEIETKKFQLLTSLGFRYYVPPSKPVIAKIIPNSPAEQAGLKPQDRIISVAGQPCSDWDGLMDVLDANAGHPTAIKVMRQGILYDLILKPKRMLQNGGYVSGYIGVQSLPMQWPPNMIRWEHYSMWGAWKPAFMKTWHTIQQMFVMIKKLITGQISYETVSGPIGIAQGASISASLGLGYFLDFIGLVSISVGVLNLLPIPALDGGHFMYYLIEFVRRKPLSEGTKALGMRVGFILLFTLMLLAIYNDIGRLLY